MPWSCRSRYRLVTQTFPISYGKAGDIIASLQKMKTDRGSVNFDERTNTIIVQDVPEQVKLIGKLSRSWIKRHRGPDRGQDR